MEGKNTVQKERDYTYSLVMLSYYFVSPGLLNKSQLAWLTHHANSPMKEAKAEDSKKNLLKSWGMKKLLNA